MSKPKQSTEAKQGHTSGPWKHDETWGLITQGDTEICALHSGNKANARLIAAAPELLEQLKLALHEIQRSDRWDDGNDVTARLVDTIRDTIAKAEGQD